MKDITIRPISEIDMYIKTFHNHVVAKFIELDGTKQKAIINDTKMLRDFVYTELEKIGVDPFSYEIETRLFCENIIMDIVNDYERHYD